MKELAKTSSNELSKLGYSTNEIGQIKNYRNTYLEHIKELSKLGDDVLVEHGYTERQIKIFRKLRESEEQEVISTNKIILSEEEMVILAAELDIYSSPANFKYDGNYTRGRLAYNWSWKGVPAFKLQDAVAASWNDWVVTDNSSYVSYYAVTTGKYYTQKTATFTTDGNGTVGAGHKFSVGINDNYYYAKNGGGTFDLRSDVHYKKDFYYYIAYGHSGLWPSISFSIGKGGADASISFNYGTNIVGEDRGSYEF